MATKQGNSGSFKPGQSGNPRGRRPRDPAPATRTDALERRDTWQNAATGHGTARDRRILTSYGVDVVTDIEARLLRRSEFLAARIVEALPEEAYRRGWSLKIEDKELAEEVSAIAEELQLEEKFVEAAQLEREAGGAALYPVLDGALGDLREPLDPNAITEVKAYLVLEPQELQPVDYYNKLGPKFGLPERYRLQPLHSGRSGWLPMQEIHESRLIIFPGIKFSRQTQPGQREGWGDSALSRPRQVLADFGLAWGSAATLLHEHGLGVLEMDDLAEILARADGLDEVNKRVAAMMMAKSTLRSLIIGSGDKYTRMTSSLAGVAEVLNEFKQLMAAAAEMPVSILIGMAQSGLRTGDDDTRQWYATVEKRRAKRYKPRHEQAIRLILLSRKGPTGGDEPDVWSIEYPSLWTPSEKETAETRKTDMERAKIAIDAGVCSADDVAESFYGGDTYSPEIVIDWDRREAQAAADAERAEELDAAAVEAMGRDGEPMDGEPDPDEEEPDDEEDDLDDAILDDAERADEADIVWDLDDEDADLDAALLAAQERIAEIEVKRRERAAR